MQLNLCTHWHNCCAICFKFLLKSIAHSAVLLTCAMSLLTLVFFEAFFLFLFVLDAACDTGRDTIATMLNATHQWTFSIEEVEDALGKAAEEVWPAFCDTTQKSKDGAFLSFVGSVWFTCGQFVIAQYWMKYSTLALASSFQAQPLVASSSHKPSVVVPMADQG